MSSEKTLKDQLTGEGLKNVPDSVIELLLAQDYDSVEALREASITQEEFERMEISMRWAKKLAAVYGPQENVAPAVVTTPTAGPLTLDAQLLDMKTVEFVWQTMRTYPRSVVEKLVSDFFADTSNKTSTGYRFMAAVEQYARQQPIAKLRGTVSQEGTTELVWRLLQGTANIENGIFKLTPQQLFSVGSLADVNKKLLKKDVLNHIPSFLEEGSGMNSLGVQLYTDDWAEPVVPVDVLKFLALAQINNELSESKAITIAEKIRGNEAATTVEDLRWTLPNTYRQVMVHGVEEKDYPELEGENRPFFGDSSPSDHLQGSSDLTHLQALLDEIQEKLPFEIWQNRVYFFGESWEIYQTKLSLNTRKLRFSRTGINDQPIDLPLKADAIDRLIRGDRLEWSGVTTESFITTLYEALEPYFIQQEQVIISEAGALRKKITQYFSLSEIRDLCSDMDIVYENIAGDTLTDKSRGLIGFCQRQGMMPLLMTNLQRLRPNVQW